jgi:hypothetical protein
MSNPATRPSAHIKQEKPAPAAEPAAPPEPPRRLSWTLRLALFLWSASFVALFGYELLNAITRGVARLFARP